MKRTLFSLISNKLFGSLKKIFSAQLLLATLFVFVVGCTLRNSEAIKLQSPLSNNSDDQVLDLNQLSYKVVNDRILLAKCVGCHSEKGGNKGDVNLETYENVFENKAEVRAEVFNRSMPPKKRVDLALTEKEIEIILSWIDHGAPKEQSEQQPTVPTQPAEPVQPQPPVAPQPVTPAPTEPPSTTNPPVAPPTEPPPVVVQPIYFSEVLEKVIAPNCLKCHSEKGGNKGDINLETYQNVVENRFDIKADIEDGSMPPKPPKGIPLTEEQKSLILNWISQGFPEKP